MLAAGMHVTAFTLLNYVVYCIFTWYIPLLQARPADEV